METSCGFDEQLERVSVAVSSGERRALLSRLLEAHRDGDPGLTITQLATATGTSRFTASRHLGVLRSAGLVSVDVNGTRRPHRIELDGLLSLDDWLGPFVDQWIATDRATEVVA